MNELLRQYEPEERGEDGYPFAWHFPSGEIIARGDTITASEERPAIKDLIREQAGHRCQRCGHPYRKGEHGNVEWTPCGDECSHMGPWRIIDQESSRLYMPSHSEARSVLDARAIALEKHWSAAIVEAQWRILTTHHLTGIKSDCRWGNLAALCQRCHLAIQGKVKMVQVFPFEHSEWFKPHAAWWYAVTYLEEENPSRETVMERLDDLLALERVV